MTITFSQNQPAPKPIKLNSKKFLIEELNS
jgi:hypothetical protein